MSAAPLLRAEGLRVGYEGRAILPGLDLAIAPGSLWALVGRNGSGKTTLLRTLLGLLPPVDGRLSRPEAGRVAYVPQRHRFDPLVPMRAIDLVSQGLEAGWSFLRPVMSRDDKARVKRALERTGATAFAKKRFAELSEGQKQRVLLARAVVAEPALIVLDEPTSAMDVVAAGETIAVLESLASDLGTAVLLVSHHLSSAMAFADHAVFVDADHQLAAVGSVAEVMATPLFRHHFGGLVDGPEGGAEEGGFHG